MSDSDGSDFSEVAAPVRAPKKRAAPKKAAAAKPVAKRAKKKTKDVSSEDDMSGSDLDAAYGTGETGMENANTEGFRKGKTIEEIYQKKTQHEHILLRPDTYIGSINHEEAEMWIMVENAKDPVAATPDAANDIANDADDGAASVSDVKSERDDAASVADDASYAGDAKPKPKPKPKNVLSPLKDHMVLKKISFVPGFYKIFDEILVNAADNKVRDPKMKLLKVNVDRETSTITVHNDGKGIPIEMHQKEKMYVPELIFGHLLTSSNYDDNEKKVTGGRNGFGAKLCNIYSDEFIVETADAKMKKHFKQVFTENMFKRSEPEVTAQKGREISSFTRITFRPDLKRFGMNGIEEDTYALLKKRVYDMAGVLRNVKVYFNDDLIPIRHFKDYVNLYLTSPSFVSPAMGLPTAAKPMVYESVNERWEVAFALSDGNYNQVSFVNSICTYNGGFHVNHVESQISNFLIETMKKKDKRFPLKPSQVRGYLWVFVNCLIENPSFNSQTKDTMTLKVSDFGSKCPLPLPFLKNCTKTGILDVLASFARFKSDLMLKKTDGSMKNRISGITKLDDANNAGTKKGAQCTLILTEGDSAKSLAVAGLSVIGRDNYGVFPLRGKMLNVRDASSHQVGSNVEINSIKKIMGLQHGREYTSTEGLRYGSIMIMTDQDHDGSHIKGLIINFLDTFWPSLMKVPTFLVEFITPIVRATKGTRGSRNYQEISFYTMPQYETWKASIEASGDRGWYIKYYKGLGTSSSEDAKRYFSAMDAHRRVFDAITLEDRQFVDLAFNKKKADQRKDWLAGFQPGTYMDHEQINIPIRDFVNKELILYSMADNIRSIPSCVDGLKPGHRKIMFACFKRNLRSEIKVAQLVGYVGEHTAYHHGEQSLASTIIGLAQSYVGSNNVPLLEPLGQFGTRLQGGKDAASPRYIFTTLNTMARKIFHPADDALLDFLNEDGQNIEPTWYMPILPMVLVNGAEGIGTGWASFIPNYNPRDIVDSLLARLDGDSFMPIHPWYRGFKGTIELDGPDKYKVTGKIKKVDDKTLEITELPIRCWTQSYKEQLETWLTGDSPSSSNKDPKDKDKDKKPILIKDYREYHTESSVHFILTLTKEQMEEAEAEGLEKRFKLTSTLNTSNMVLFDKDGRIRKYSSVEEILDEFYDMRLEYYQRRKRHLLMQIEHEYKKADNKVRFIREILSGELVIQKKKRVDVVVLLKARDYMPIITTKAKAVREAASIDEPPPPEDGDEPAADAANDPQGAGGYDYLLSMPMYSLTLERIEQLSKDMAAKRAELERLNASRPEDMWQADLKDFVQSWTAFEAMMDEQAASTPKARAPARGRGKKDSDDYEPGKARAKPKPKPKVKAESPSASPGETKPKPKAAGAGADITAWLQSKKTAVKGETNVAASALSSPSLATATATASPSSTAPKRKLAAAGLKKAGGAGGVGGAHRKVVVSDDEDSDEEDFMPMLKGESNVPMAKAAAAAKPAKAKASPSSSSAGSKAKSPAAAKPKAKPAAAKSKAKSKATVLSDSDDLDDEASFEASDSDASTVITREPGTRPSRRAAAQAKTKYVGDDSDASESDDYDESD